MRQTCRAERISWHEHSPIALSFRAGPKDQTRNLEIPGSRFARPGMTTSERTTKMTDGLRKGLASYGDAGFSLFLRKAFIKAMGYSNDALDRPIVGITNTYSDYNPCHGNVPQIIEAAKRGVMLSGAMPMVFPTISIAESFSHPTSMYLRNLMAMDTEEMIRAQPMDSIIVIGGCDKTLPAQMMAAVSADLPTVVIPVGPMVVGHHKGEVLGACTDWHRQHHGLRHRGAGPVAAHERDYSSTTCRALSLGGSQRQGRRRDGQGKR